MENIYRDPAPVAAGKQQARRSSRSGASKKSSSSSRSRRTTNNPADPSRVSMGSTGGNPSYLNEGMGRDNNGDAHGYRAQRPSGGGEEARRDYPSSPSAQSKDFAPRTGGADTGVDYVGAAGGGGSNPGGGALQRRAPGAKISGSGRKRVVNRLENGHVERGQPTIIREEFSSAGGGYRDGIGSGHGRGVPRAEDTAREGGGGADRAIIEK